jgi:hypothetical protein
MTKIKGNAAQNFVITVVISKYISLSGVQRGAGGFLWVAIFI